MTDEEWLGAREDEIEGRKQRGAVATFVRVEFWLMTVAKLYRLSEPVRWRDRSAEVLAEFVVVSASRVENESSTTAIAFRTSAGPTTTRRCAPLASGSMKALAMPPTSGLGGPHRAVVIHQSSRNLRWPPTTWRALVGVSTCCCLCGLPATTGVPYTKWQGANFTDQKKLKNYGGSHVCEPCVWAHSWVPPPGHAPPADGKKGVNLRLFSHFWCGSTGYVYLNKASKIDMLRWLRSERHSERLLCA